MDLDPGGVRALVSSPDRDAVPDGFVVTVGAGERVHFLDWGGPPAAPGVLLIHGLSGTAWAWTPVARRLRSVRRVAAMDLRGHGLSDAPVTGYEPEALAADVVAAAEGAGVLGGSGAGDSEPVVLAGHGFGAIVAAWAAAILGNRCAGLVLLDGGWEDVEESSAMDVDEFLRGLAEPPEIMRSMAAFLADRQGWDPSSWDADQEFAARATVVETAAGRVVPATRPGVLEACVRAMFEYRPGVVLPSIAAPIVALVAADDEAGARGRALDAAGAAMAAAGRRPIRVARFPLDGHNLIRYRPDEVTAAILSVTEA